MKKRPAIIFCIYIISLNAIAQSPQTGTAKIEYKTILKLNDGERIDALLSCWWLNDKKEPRQVVIQQPDGKFSVVEKGQRRDGVTREQLMLKADCDKFNPYKVPGETHASPFSRLLPNGQYNIHSAKKDLGNYEKILFMREWHDRFVALVLSRKNNADQYFLLNADGEKISLDGRPEDLFTNQDLSRVGVMLDNKGTPTIEQVNQMSNDAQTAFYDKLRTDPIRRIWFNDNSMATVSRKSKLFFDASGRHFIEAKPQAFYIDGAENKRNITGNTTQLFVNRDGSNWAYFYMIYLTFKDNTTIQSAINPYISEEGGKEYLNWFKVDKENNTTVLKQGRREL